AWPRVVSRALTPGGRAVLSRRALVSRTTGRAAGGGGGGGGGGGFCAHTGPAHPIPSTIAISVAAAMRRARRRLAIQAHQMLNSYGSSSGPSISIIDTASGGVRIAARNAAITIAYRRWRPRNCGVTMPSDARIVTTSGSSATKPHPATNGTAIAK